MLPSIQIAAITIPKRAGEGCIVFILTFGVFALSLSASEAPRNLAKLAAEREAQAAKRGQWRDSVLEPYSTRYRKRP